MEGWRDYINRAITIFYDDGQAVSKKVGLLVSMDNDFLYIKTSNDNLAIPKNRVVRIELGSSGGSD